MPPALEITDLVKKYGERTAVDSLSLVVPRGSFFGFLGPNGAGKSTTINCIVGVNRITSGTVKVFGIDVETEYREARKKVGIAPQEFNMDIFEQTWRILDYVAGYYGLERPQREARIDQILTQFDLQAHKNKPFKELSGGLKRRVALARALVHDPEFLILDEPTAGVDVELRHDLWRYFKELNQAGKTILLTSHYLEEVEMLCDNIAIINHGKIVAQGTKDEFLKDGSRLEEKYLEITRKEKAAV